MNILEVRNLTKVYGTGESEVRALNDVSFDVEKASLSQSSDRAAAANQRCCTRSAVWIVRQAERSL